MLDLRPITSLDLPELDPFRSMKRAEAQRRQGLFVAEGELVVRRLLANSRFGVLTLLLPSERLDKLRPQIEARPEAIPTHVAPKRLLENLTGYPLYQGVMALGRIPALPALEDVLRQSPRPWLFAAVDGVTNAPNIGTIVRNAVAFGVQALFVGPTACSPFLRRAVRSSMGAVFEIAVVENLDLVAALSALRDRNVLCLAAHPAATGSDIFSMSLQNDCCILFGHEGLGLGRPLLDACDQAVAIPMPSTVDSLNVGSAAAVFFYEAARQRRQRPTNPWPGGPQTGLKTQG